MRIGLEVEGWGNLKLHFDIFIIFIEINYRDNK